MCAKKNPRFLKKRKKHGQQEMDDLVKQMNVSKKVLKKLAENLSKDKNSPSESKTKIN